MRLTRGERFEEARRLCSKTMDKVVEETNKIQIPAEGYPDRNPDKKISKSTISKLENTEEPNYEKKEYIPEDVGYSKIAKLAICYGVSADYLMGLSEVKSPDITFQGIGKKTGLSDNAIRNIQSINGISDEPVGDYELEFRDRLNSFLGHPKLREFIYNIQSAKQSSESTMPASITTEEIVNAIEAPSKIGSRFLANYEVKKFYRQEAINALRDIVYDLIPDRKDKKEE